MNLYQLLLRLVFWPLMFSIVVIDCVVMPVRLDKFLGKSTAYTRNEAIAIIQLQGEVGLTQSAKLELVTGGKCHQVKRMFAAVGHRVVPLHCHSIGKIELDIEEGGVSLPFSRRGC